MATNCDVCGNKTNEVKSATGVEEKGLKITIKVRSKEDFTRDILKSETCHIKVPELELDVGPTTLGGRFTTVEGLLVAMREQLTKESCIFTDSLDCAKKEMFNSFLKQLDLIVSGEKSATLILDDPAGNSYVQSLSNNDEPDDGIVVERYERSFEQNEELGINDMKTENYETDT